MTRFGWWENTVTTHPDLRSATTSALNRTVDVDEDTGVPPAVSMVRIAGGVGRNLAATTASIAGIPLRTTPRGWEMTAHPSLESRRTAGYLREIWDLAEELLVERTERIMVHVLGPWSMGAQIEYRGHAAIYDRPAFRDMALTMGEATGEYARTLSKATGAEVSVAVHEPQVGQILSGLPGATRFDGLDPIDPEFVTGVWRRLVRQVAASCVLTCDGPVPPALLGVDGSSDATSDLRATNFSRIEFPFSQLGASTKVTDAIGSLIGAEMGTERGIAVSLPTSALNARSAAEIEEASANVAKGLMRQWAQWTLPAPELPNSVDITVPEATRSAAEASSAAAVARGAAALLWKN